MNYSAIIVAGGTGSRMNSAIPKQFLELRGIPILVHTIKKFLAWNTNVELVVVVHPDYLATWEDIRGAYFSSVSIQTAVGGDTRFHSVKNGLELVSANRIVGVHDAARPLVTQEVLERCFSVAMQNKSAIPVVPIHESMRQVKGDSSIHLDRKNYSLVQTPQCFNSDILKKAYEQEFSPLFTDDASVYESMGHSVSLVNGNRENIKITEAIDMKIASALLE